MSSLIDEEKIEKENELLNLQKEKSKYELYLERLDEEEKKLEKQMESLSNTKYDNSGFEIAISTLNKRKEILSKHPIIYRRKIREIDSRITELNNKNTKGIKQFDSNRSSDKFKLEEEMKTCKNSIIEYENELKNVEMKIEQINIDIQNLSSMYEDNFDNNFMSNINLENDTRISNNNSKSNGHLK